MAAVIFGFEQCAVAIFGFERQRTSDSNGGGSVSEPELVMKEVKLVLAPEFDHINTALLSSSF